MTTKHVVADDLYGKLCKRIGELQRRVLEGTIPIHDALDAVQGIIMERGSGNDVIPASLDAALDKPTLERALSEVAEKRKKGSDSLCRLLFESPIFDHVEVGRYYFTKHHCGKRTLQVRVYYRIQSGKIYSGADEMLCTVCWRHESNNKD